MVVVPFIWTADEREDKIASVAVGAIPIEPVVGEDGCSSRATWGCCLVVKSPQRLQRERRRWAKGSSVPQVFCSERAAAARAGSDRQPGHDRPRSGSDERPKSSSTGPGQEKNPLSPLESFSRGHFCHHMEVVCTGVPYRAILPCSMTNKTVLVTLRHTPADYKNISNSV